MDLWSCFNALQDFSSFILGCFGKLWNSLEIPLLKTQLKWIKAQKLSAGSKIYNKYKQSFATNGYWGVVLWQIDAVKSCWLIVFLNKLIWEKFSWPFIIFLPKSPSHWMTTIILSLQHIRTWLNHSKFGKSPSMWNQSWCCHASRSNRYFPAILTSLECSPVFSPCFKEKKGRKKIPGFSYMYYPALGCFLELVMITGVA